MDEFGYTVEKVPARIVAGLERRTCNADGRSAQDIPATWQDFLSKNAAAKIPFRAAPPTMYAVYSRYTTDWTGEYSYLLGCGVTKADNVPDGLVARRIPEQTCAHFVARGPMPDAVVGVWAGIWGSDLPRAYTYDFEVFDRRFTDKDHPEVDVYVAIKEE